MVASFIKNTSISSLALGALKFPFIISTIEPIKSSATLCSELSNNALTCTFKCVIAAAVSVT